MGNNRDILVTQGANNYKALSFETITPITTVEALTIPNGAVYAIIQIEASGGSVKAVRISYSGTAPTGTEGFAYGDKDMLDITEFSNLEMFKIIRDDSCSDTVTATIQYFKL